MMTARTWIGLATESAGVLSDDWPDVDGPGGSPSLRGRMAVRPVITEDSRGRLGAGGWLCGSVITEDIRGIQDRVPERGVEHRQPPSWPVSPSPAKVTLTSGGTAHLTRCRPAVSCPVLTSPLANGLQKGGQTKIK